MLFQIYPSDVEAQLSKIAEMHMDCDFYGCSFSDNKLIHLRDNQLSIWHYEVDTLITTGIGRGYNHVVLFSIPLLRLVGLSFRTDFGLRQDYKRFTNFWCLNLAHKFHVCGHAIISFILCFLRWRRWQPFHWPPVWMVFWNPSTTPFRNFVWLLSPSLWTGYWWRLDKPLDDRAGSPSRSRESDLRALSSLQQYSREMVESWREDWCKGLQYFIISQRFWMCHQHHFPLCSWFLHTIQFLSFLWTTCLHRLINWRNQSPWLSFCTTINATFLN